MVGEPNSKVKSQKHRPASHCPTSTTRLNLSARETKVNAAQIQQALNQTERSHKTGILFRLAAQSLLRFRLGKPRNGHSNVNVNARARGC